MKSKIFAVLFVLSSPQFASADDGCVRFREALHEASALTGIAIHHEPRCAVLMPLEFNKTLNESSQAIDYEKFLPRDELLYRMLGMISWSFDYRACIFRYFQSSTIAFYDPRMRTVFLRSDLRANFRTLAHEATHALQHQLVDLKRYLDPTIHTTDAIMARLALIEGQAEQVADELTTPGRVEPQPLSVPPPAQCELSDGLILLDSYPYDVGSHFARAIARRSGSDAVTRLLQSPPTSTNAVARLIAPPEHSGSPAPTAQEEGGSAATMDTLGQYFIRALAGEYRKGAEALKVAHGWVHDELSFAGSMAEPRGFEWSVRWLRESDAEEFFALLCDIGEALSGAPIKKSVSRFEVYSPRRGTIAAARQKNVVSYRVRSDGASQ